VSPEEVLHIYQWVRPLLWSRCVPPLWPSVQPIVEVPAHFNNERSTTQFESQPGTQLSARVDDAPALVVHYCLVRAHLSLRHPRPVSLCQPHLRPAAPYPDQLLRWVVNRGCEG
jgi:hypothetical protein